VRILQAFSQDDPALTVSEIGRRSGLHVATASRLVNQLIELGLLNRDEQRRVRIGVRLWELVTRASPQLSLRDVAMPFMEGMHDLVRHHVQLGVLDGDEVLFLERLSAPGAVINYSRIAGRLPLYASSSGLVLLTYGPAELRERVLAGPFTAYTAKTPASDARLRAVLADVRRQGFAYCPGYVHEEALGIAAPVRDTRGRVVAALSVIVPNEAGAQALVPVVRAAAHGLTRALHDPAGASSRFVHPLRRPTPNTPSRTD
jgi:DNA-binding IclR family transcriptional regulator